MQKQEPKLPDIIAGPILRRVTRHQFVVWLATSKPLDISLLLYRHDDGTTLFKGKVSYFSPKPIQVGQKAFIQIVSYRSAEPFPENVLLGYDLIYQSEEDEKSIATSLPDLLYPNQKGIVFTFKPTIDHLFHGSCRKPHHKSADALLRIDKEFEETVGQVDNRPSFLIMTGDQIYADDVGGPMLVAIHQVIQLLGLYPEKLDGAVVSDSDELLKSDLCYYRREELLPRSKETQSLKDLFFGGVRKPIFTTASAHNHMVTLAEATAMYLLIWSPELWKFVTLKNVEVPASHKDLYTQELEEVEKFADGMPKIRRMLAHLSTYMIFDDHDVTDDWNLTRGWEEVAYENLFSRRIIGNTLIAYFLFQAWGNNPEQFNGEFIEHVHDCFLEPGGEQQDRLINYLLGYEQWNYCLPTSPKVVVLDTRTKRWWSESTLSKPSGLMDWETLSDLQQELMDQSSVLLVSPAPIFGVKLIEVVQRFITFLGYPLLVDAENWMAHPGSANVILNIFRHRKTPKNFIILSGDVHYHFAYDVSLKHKDNSPNIWQITCSGFKNEFPHGLLRWFDRLNRWLYASHSPLNWLTKRRRMRIRSRKPDTQSSRRLICESGVGRVRLDREGKPTEISVLTASGNEVRFQPREH